MVEAFEARDPVTREARAGGPDQEIRMTGRREGESREQRPALLGGEVEVVDEEV